MSKLCNKYNRFFSTLSWIFFVVLAAIFVYYYIYVAKQNPRLMSVMHSTTEELDHICSYVAECADKTFDANVLTFLISFSLIAILTLLLQEKDKLLEIRLNVEKEHEKLRNHFYRDERIYRYNILTQSIQSDCVVFASTIISSNYVNHILAAIESTRLRIMNFNEEVQLYGRRIREEDIFTRTEIDELTTPLYFAENQIEDLISGARTYFRAHYRGGYPTIEQELYTFEQELSPLRDDIHSLIEKFESHLEAPQNREG